MRKESFPAWYPLERRFPRQVAIRGYEGGEICTAEAAGKFYVIVDESTMAEFLNPKDPSDKEVIDRLVSVLEFDDEAERGRHVAEHCNYGVRLDKPEYASARTLEVGTEVSKFARRFYDDPGNIQVLEDSPWFKGMRAVLEENPWFMDMLQYWRPAGDSVPDDGAKMPNFVPVRKMSDEAAKHLRLAIRKGYLNLYRGGQSIGMIGFDKLGKLKAHIHCKYVYGDNGLGQSYVALTSKGLYDKKTDGTWTYRGPEDLSCWLANANKYIGEEKRFVDQVVGHNANTIDLEMALPAFGPPPRVAPKMDLVTLEPAGDWWQIVFWEAKLVDNPCLRCKGDCRPKVVDQLEKYMCWLRFEGHSALVAKEYQNACRLLLAFHKLAKTVNSDIEELGPGIIAAAMPGAPSLLIDHDPRLLIYDWPHDTIFTERHLNRLRDEFHYHVQMVSGIGDMTLDAHA